MNERIARAFEPAVLAGLLSLLLAGCTTPSGEPYYTGTGALAGAAGGAGLGALIDHRNPGVGALIGGAAGAVTGGLIGHAMDQDAHRPVYIVETPPPVQPAPVVEAVPASPGPGYAWVAGHWVWNGSAWYWEAGHWAEAPQTLTVWVPGCWVDGPSGRYWQPGHWQ